MNWNFHELATFHISLFNVNNQNQSKDLASTNGYQFMRCSTQQQQQYCSELPFTVNTWMLWSEHHHL